MANAGAPPHGDQVPPLEEDANMEQTLVNPPPLKDENTRTLIQMTQAITNQAQATTSHAQAMIAQENLDVVPRPLNKSLHWLPV